MIDILKTKSILPVIWHLIFAISIWIGSQLPAIFLMNLPAPINIILNILTQIVLVICAVYLYSKFILKTDLRDNRIAKRAFSPRWVIVAVLIPLLFSILFIMIVPGNFQSIEHTTTETALLLVNGSIGGAVGAAITEEVIFRGFCMRYIERRMGLFPAMIIPSFIFGITHIVMADTMGISDTILLIISGTLVGIMFSVITYYCNSIWPSVLVHGLWNFRSTLLGISENPKQSCLWLYQFESQPKLLSGGNFGIESSLAAMLIYSAVIFSILLLIRKDRNAKHQYDRSFY